MSKGLAELNKLAAPIMELIRTAKPKRKTKRSVMDDPSEAGIRAAKRAAEVFRKALDRGQP